MRARDKSTLTRRSRHRSTIHRVLRADFVAMPSVLSPRKSQAVAACLQLNLEPEAIQNTTSVSQRQIRRIKRNIAVYGSIRKPKVVKQGPPYKVTDEMAEVHPLLILWR